MNERHYERVLVHRERHRSRSTAVSIALVLVALAAVYLGVECVLAAVGRAPLAASPAQLIRDAGTVTPITLAVAVVLAVLGLIAILLSILPGRRPRHRLADDRIAVLVDDDVLAGAVSAAAADAASVPRAQVRTSMGSRRAEVSVRPVSGFPVASEDVADAVTGVLGALAPKPRVRAVVRVSPHGVMPG